MFYHTVTSWLKVTWLKVTYFMFEVKVTLTSLHCPTIQSLHCCRLHTLWLSGLWLRSHWPSIGHLTCLCFTPGPHDCEHWNAIILYYYKNQLYSMFRKCSYMSQCNIIIIFSSKYYPFEIWGQSVQTEYLKNIINVTNLSFSIGSSHDALLIYIQDIS